MGEPLVLRHSNEHVRRRKRNMEEESNGVRHAVFTQARPERNEMIVVHPNEVAGLQARSQHFCEKTVHTPIAPAALLRESSEVEPVMMHWPERAIGKAEVIITVVALRERHGDDVHLSASFAGGV